MSLPEQFRVQVTDEDMLLGVRHDSEQCPIRRALVRTLRLEHKVSADYAAVGMRYASMRAGQERAEYEHTGHQFVIDYDGGNEWARPIGVWFTLKSRMLLGEPEPEERGTFPAQQAVLP